MPSLLSSLYECIAGCSGVVENVGTTSQCENCCCFIDFLRKFAFELQKNLGVLLFWFVENKRDGSCKKPGLFSTMLCTLETRGPGVSHTSLVPTMAALFLDENLPDGTRLEPGTKFIKYWKMRNSGTISWTSETKVPPPCIKRTSSTFSLPLRFTSTESSQLIASLSKSSTSTNTS